MCLRGIVAAGEDVLSDESDAAEAAADLVVQIPRDALPQGLHLAESGASLPVQPDEKSGH